MPSSGRVHDPPIPPRAVRRKDCSSPAFALACTLHQHDSAWLTGYFLSSGYLALTSTVCCGCTGSFELTVNWKRCFPPIPGCMLKATLIVVDFPGSIVVEPTTGFGGQQPWATLTSALPMVSFWSPTFLTWKVALTSFWNGT